MITAATRRHKGEALARKQAFAQWRQDNHRCPQLQRRHACTHAFASPVLKKSPPAFAHSESKGTSTYRAYLRRCCMLPILLAVHRHKGKAPCPHTPRKRSHSGGLAKKAQRMPSSHANVHVLGARSNLPSRWLTRRQGTRQGSPRTHRAQLCPWNIP